MLVVSDDSVKTARKHYELNGFGWLDSSKNLYNITVSKIIFLHAVTRAVNIVFNSVRGIAVDQNEAEVFKQMKFTLLGSGLRRRST